jgi:hypothetical protein
MPVRSYSQTTAGETAYLSSSTKEDAMRQLGLVAATAGAIAAATTAVAFGAGGALPLGPSSHGTIRMFLGFYDGHKDTFVVTDVSNKAQAMAMHVNYAPALRTVKGAPDQYFVVGRAARGQLSVFGSEPGERSYNPLWDEEVVTWKTGVKPVLLVKDDQIEALEKEGKLRLREPHIILNAPITKVGGK